MLPLAEKVIAFDFSVRELEAEVRRLNRLSTKADVEEEDEEEVRVDYVKELERRMTSHLGRRVKLSTKGAKKSLTLYFEDNDDLDELLTLICGKDFVDAP